MLSSTLRQMIVEYLSAEISLTDLEERLVSELPALIENPDSSDADAVAAIELCLAEWADGIRDESEVRSLLRELIEAHETVHLDLQPDDLRMNMSSANASSSLQRSMIDHSFTLSPGD